MADDVPGRRGGEIDWTTAVEQVLAGLEGNHVLMLPVYDDAGEVADFEITAASPGTVDVFGRTADQIMGARLREDYGEAVNGPVWQAFTSVFADGVPRTVGPFPFPRPGSDLPPAPFTVSLRRVGAGLLDSWARGDDLGRPEERISRAERLADFGWAERDLVTGRVVWSDHLFRIYERDPAAGPLSIEESETLILPEDRPRFRRAAQRLNAGRPVDVTFRIRVHSGVKHIRAVTEPVCDVAGRVLRTVGILQDVTARVTSGTRLARAEQELSRNQESLASENQLVAELQQIILPIPVVPIDLGGLRVAVRYLPAEHANRIGGDWYHAATALDGSVVLAVGDVAGHGIRSAATMAKLRHAFATLIATATSEPAELLLHLNRLLHAGGEPTELASAVVARYDSDSGALEWAQAGHPAPLRTRAGVTTELARPVGVLLGVVPAPVYETASIPLRPGELLVFYTDGLIERRGQSLDDGLRPVVDTLNRLTAHGSPQPLADLLAQLDRANPDDDTCIVAVRQLAPAGNAEPAHAEQAHAEPAHAEQQPAPPEPMGTPITAPVASSARPRSPVS